MRFTRLHIANFRAIRNFELADLTDFVLIAGPNGCGKSCVFDAIRLLKSVYGGYQENEWMQWFGEFQINLNDRTQLARMFRNPTIPLRVAASVQLSTEEKTHLRDNAEKVLEPLVWRSVTGQNLDNFGRSTTALATQFRQHGEAVKQALASRTQQLRAALDEDSYDLALEIRETGPINVQPNPTMEVVFQTYDPAHLGIIDYHSASRNYQREQVGGVTLDASNLEAQRRQQSLYNWQGKYQNIKTELASTYVRELVAEKSGRTLEVSNLNETLHELFQTFFPDKEYLGVQAMPNGGLTFPVRVKSGEVHDINELSSGEKEVLYGYLRLRSSTPKHSTILLDEPELHLNPGLLRGFPDFYHRHLGREQGNQLWLVTHSDTLLRQAVGNFNYSVYHMTSASTESDVSNQALPVTADDELERAMVDLVGDLATYRPQGKVVLFEGGGDTEIDVLITQRLFPDFSKRVNLISGGNKRRVRDLYEVLSSTAEQVGMAERFYAITDKDSAVFELPAGGTRHLSWDAYHIENYLLEPKFVRAAAAALLGRDHFQSDDDVTQALRAAAEVLVPRLVLERLQKSVNDELVAALNIGARPDSPDPAAAILPSVAASYERLDSARPALTDMAELKRRADDFDAALRRWLEDGSWIREFPGRLILKRFLDHNLGTAASYEAFRNVILDKMVDDRYQPQGMRSVISAVLASPET